MGPIVVIDKMKSSDWEQVRQIYLEGIETGNATFQTEAPSWESWDQDHLSECRIVARAEGQILGWAALTPTSGRPVYAGVAEVSVYVGKSNIGKGIGSKLMKDLIELSEEKGYWLLQSGIFPENKTSLKLHNKFGFREVGRRERIGKMNNIWRDVILVERRSSVVGVD
jgi:L-amino acid N-acyltransferase YncA